MMDKATREANRAQWWQHIEVWQTSDLTQVAYCKQHQLNHEHFGYYLSQYKKKQAVAKPAIANVNIKPTALQALSIQLPNGIQIKLPASLSMTELASLAKELA